MFTELSVSVLVVSVRPYVVFFFVCGLLLEARKLFLKIVQRRQGEANGDSRGNHCCGIAGRGFGGPDGVSSRLEKKGLVHLNFSQPKTKGLSHTKKIFVELLFSQLYKRYLFLRNAITMPAFYFPSGITSFMQGSTCRSALLTSLRIASLP